MSSEFHIIPLMSQEVLASLISTADWKLQTMFRNSCKKETHKRSDGGNNLVGHTLNTVSDLSGSDFRSEMALNICMY